MVPDEVGKWFKRNRESYSWPDGRTRQQSEEFIASLLAKARSALDSGDTASLRQSLIDVYSWKNFNMRGIINRYRRTLQAKGDSYIEDLRNMSALTGPDNLVNLEAVIRHLLIPNSRLPDCASMASFLYGRDAAPVLDRYVAQFFNRGFSRYDLDDETKATIETVGHIDFRVEEDGSGRLRVATFNEDWVELNVLHYVNEMVPECARVAVALNAAGHTYTALDGAESPYAPVDVEMAIFAWSSRNRHLFG